MKYIGKIYRPPSEARSLIFQITIGCSHNKCSFCNMYKEKSFKIRSLDDIEEDLKAMSEDYYKRVRRIFLGDGDALIMKTDQLKKVLVLIKKYYPYCERVGIYGSARSVLIKSIKELKELKELGLGIIYMGLESGSNEILEDINKGEKSEDIVKAGKMVKESGIILSVTAISGMGGREKTNLHAIETAKAFSEMNPDYIGLLTLMIEDDTPIYEKFVKGEFNLMEAEEIAHENMVFLKNIDSEGTVLRSNHASNYLSLDGILNKDKEKLINKIEKALKEDGSFKEEWFRML
ncbi:MAG: radical SAM protein [Filifactoraceae bacterium]